MEGTISVSCRLSDCVQQLILEVEDDGIGISTKSRQTLFQPFKQAQNMAGGTGLGLYSMSKRLEALGGACGIKDRADGARGTVFWFSVPYTPDRTLTDSREFSTRLASKSHHLFTPDTPRKMSILLVDDSLVIQKATKRIISRQGHCVEVASNGLLGLNMMLQKKYDLVLMGESHSHS
jgi:hypothetical protein